MVSENPFIRREVSTLNGLNESSCSCESPSGRLSWTLWLLSVVVMLRVDWRGLWWARQVAVSKNRGFLQTLARNRISFTLVECVQSWR